MSTRSWQACGIGILSLLLPTILLTTANAQFHIDHFKVYALKPQNVADKVLLQGQFDKRPLPSTLVALTHLGNPVSKNQKPISNKNAHLAWFKIQSQTTEPNRRVTINNQFGNQDLLLGQPMLLAVPTEKIEPLSGPPQQLDHFKCYQVLEGKPIQKSVSLVDQFDRQEGVKVLRPLFFCVPVNKQHGDKSTKVQNSSDHLTVYEISPKPYELKKTLRNQFGKWEVAVIRSVMLAVPSRKIHWAESK